MIFTFTKRKTININETNDNEKKKDSAAMKNMLFIAITPLIIRKEANTRNKKATKIIFSFLKVQY